MSLTGHLIRGQYQYVCKSMSVIEENCYNDSKYKDTEQNIRPTREERQDKYVIHSQFQIIACWGCLDWFEGKKLF